MYQIFGDIPRCLNQRDNIMIGGATREEHDKTLREILQRARDHNVTFNKDKYEFRRTTIDLFGHRFTGDGLQPDPKEVEAITACSRPKSKEVRSFFGMTGYLDDFIPNYASIAAPLRELTKERTRFHWNKEQHKAFDSLKKEIASTRTMAYFNPSKPIIIPTKASFKEGIAAALFQPYGETHSPVHFISRTLTDPEARYSQTEKDALTIKWAKERFTSTSSVSRNSR